jgi:hypothetical protein
VSGSRDVRAQRTEARGLQFCKLGVLRFGLGRQLDDHRIGDVIDPEDLAVNAETGIDTAFSLLDPPIVVIEASGV